MTKAADLAHQLTQTRNELNNLRKTIRGLQAEHRRDVSRLKELMAIQKSTPALSPSLPQKPPGTRNICQEWRPIGHITSWFRTKNGTPRQGSVGSLTRGFLRLGTQTFSNPQHALQGLQEFSHVWILFVFDKNEESGKGHKKSKVAPPRLGGQRVGLFSTRSPHRPNPLGLTLARLDKVEGDCLHLSGLDILDGTPVLDIKPYILHYDAPPAISSHFPDPAGMSTMCIETDEDSPLHEMQLLGSKCINEPCYAGNASKNNISEVCEQMKRTVVCDEAPSNRQPTQNQDSRQGKSDVIDVKTQNIVKKDPSESTRLTSFPLDLREMHEKETKVEVSDDLQESGIKGVGGDKVDRRKVKEEKRKREEDTVVVASWITKPSITPLQVCFNPIAEDQMIFFSRQAEDKSYRLEFLEDSEELREAVCGVLREDPRSVYRRSKCPSLLYYFTVDTAHITAWFEEDCVEVLRVKPLLSHPHCSEKE